MTALTRKPWRVWMLGVALLSIVSIAAVSIAVGSGTADPAKSVEVSKLQAVASVVGFTSVDDAAALTVGEALDGAYSRFYEVRGPNVWATVDAHDGRVISVVFLGVERAGKVAISPEDASQRAHAFLDARAVPWKGLYESVALQDHGESSEYVVTWETRLGNVVAPDSRLVGIDASSGEVIRYNDQRHPYVDPGTPSIDEAAAVDAALKESGIDGGATVEKAELRIVFDPAGKQLLVWRIGLTGPVPGAPADDPIRQHVLVEVDASSGAAQVIGRG
jgi:hypothetical protein